MKNYKHSKVAKEIADKYNIHPNVVNIVIRSFFNGLRKVLKRNDDVNIKGYFKIIMKPHYKRKLKRLGKTTNLRNRKHKKKYK